MNKVTFTWDNSFKTKESLTTDEVYFKTYAASLLQDVALDEISNVHYTIDGAQQKKLTYKTLEGNS